MASAVTPTLSPGPSVRAGGWRWQGQVLWLVTTAPSRGFSSLAARPAWLLVFLLVFLLNAVYSRPMLPLATRAALGEVAAKAGPATEEGEARITRQVQIGQMIGIIVSPTFLLAKWLAVAILLWTVVTIIGRDVGLRAMFSLAAHANLPLILGYFMSLQLVILRGPDEISSLADLRPRLGLNAFVTGATPAADIWLGSFGPLDAWFVFLLIIGLENMAQLARRTAILLAVGYWLLAVTLQASLAGLGG